MASVKVTRTCDLLVLVREDLVDVLKLFPRHKARVDAYIAAFESTFYTRNSSLLQHPSKLRQSSGRSFSNANSASEGSNWASLDSPADLDALRNSGLLSDEELCRLDVSGAQLSPSIFKPHETAHGLRKTLLSRVRVSSDRSSRLSSELSRTSTSPESSPTAIRASPPSSRGVAFAQQNQSPMSESMMWNLEEGIVKPVSMLSGTDDIEMVEEAISSFKKKFGQV